MTKEGLDWYQLSLEQTFALLESGNRGLSTPEARSRQEKYGPNELTFKTPSAFVRLLRQFHNPLVYTLLAACTVTGILTLVGRDMLADTLVILGVVILNAALGFFQEGKAERALQALKKMIVSECTALRDGQQSIVPTRELVPGDVVILNGGDKVPADLRLFYTREAAADESVLTGESVPVEKHIEPLPEPDLSPGDRSCMALSGTFLVRGSAMGIVVATAEKTEFGKIASLVRQTQTVLTPLQRKISDFTRILIIAILSIGCVNFVLGSFFGYTLIYSFLASVSLVVAAIPEMLPMIVTAILALAATTMARRKALIRKLPAAETLGCATVICSDKTGTLTKNEMTVTRLYAAGRDYEASGVGYARNGVLTYQGKTISRSQLSEALRETLTAGFLCNNAILKEEDGRELLIGDPTEGALIVSALKSGVVEPLEKLDEIPFDSERMYMATLHRGPDGNRIYVKGSPERVLKLCRGQLFDRGPQPLDKETLSYKSDEMAREALRVIAMAYRVVSPQKTSLRREDIDGLMFLGMQGMIDPPREEAIEAIRLCKDAGIRTIMITGDHLLTAKAIGRQLGMIGSNTDSVLAGEKLNRMSDEDLSHAVDHVSIFARVAPEHKLRIARKLQERGHVVAMTGDGVNDAPALKAADIGVAMGITGTEVSKEASSMILTDDNFATIVGAVEEGRHAWKNLERAILYTLPTNGGQALLVMGAVLLAPFVPLFAARLPLEPIQILWVNLFDSVFLTMPLMMESKDRNILATPPRDSKAKIADALFLQRVILIGLAIAIPGFLVYYHFGAPAVVAGVVIDPLLLTQAQTASFWAVLLVHFGFVMSARSVYRSAFTFSLLSNKWLLLGILISILAHLLLTFLPVFFAIFRTAAFPLEWWLYILPCLFPGFLVLELDKFIRRHARKVA